MVKQMCLNIAKINTALEEKHETVLFGKSDYMREMVSRVFSQKKKKHRFSSGRVLKKLTGISQGPPKTVACTTL